MKRTVARVTGRREVMADAIAAFCHTCQHDIEVGSLNLDGDEPLLFCPLCNSAPRDFMG
jgi:hypothetical protein